MILSERSASGGVGDGFVFLEAGPLSCGVVHFEDRVHQHGGAAGAVCFGQNLRVFAQLDLDDVPLLRARILCRTDRRNHTGYYRNYQVCVSINSYQDLRLDTGNLDSCISWNFFFLSKSGSISERHLLVFSACLQKVFTY